MYEGEKTQMDKLDVSFYTSGWIRLISLYVEMKKKKKKSMTEFNPNMTIGNPPRKY